MNKYEETLAQYATNLNDATIAMEVEKIVRDNYEKYNTVEVYKQLFNCIDLTTLRSEDYTESVANFAKRVNAFDEEHADMPNVAAICVYPNYAGTVRMNLEVSDVNIAAVSGGFPSAQTFTEVKVAETMLAVKDGADEIDIVINVGDMLAGNYEEVEKRLWRGSPKSNSRNRCAQNRRNDKKSLYSRHLLGCRLH